MIASLFLSVLAAVDEGPVADLLLQAGVVRVAEGGEVVDPGRGRPVAPLVVAGAGLGVAVPADGERDGGPGGLPAGPDLDAGQVERVLCRPGHHPDRGSSALVRQWRVRNFIGIIPGISLYVVAR